MPIVVVERGNDKGTEVTVDDGNVYVFGRDPKVAAITLSDSLASRRHFEIRADGGSYTLTDCNSTNGTFLNDEPVKSAPLKIGDKIQVGDTILSFLSDQRQETQQGLVGKTLGGYQILERVGRGGMGTVFKAVQLSLHREVAFKVLSSRLLKDSKFIEKFVSEARAAGQLNHPNVVQVYDVGTDRNIHFFSMEFMDGASLQDKIGKDGTLDWAETLDVLEHAARALAFAERKGIVHRDVKPDNLMLTSDGQVKLADLGLARHLEKGKTAQEEGIFGTPHFISPEQALGKEVDHRADLYSLGATAYRLLAGKTPFTGANVSEIIHKQIHEDPEPLNKLVPDCPEELVDLVHRLMKKNADERPESARALLTELEQIRLQYKMKAAGVGKGGKGIFIAVVIALLAVAAVVVIALRKDKRKPPVVITSGGTTIVGTQGPTYIEKDDPELDAKVAFQDLKIAEDFGRLKDTWKTHRTEWLALAKRYEQVGADHSGTQFAKTATDRAKEIKTLIETRTRAEADALQEAGNAWNSLKAQVTNALDDGRHGDALAALTEALKDAKLTAALKLLSDAREQVDTWNSQAGGSIRARFASAFTATRKNADQLRKQRKFAEAVNILREFIGKASGEAAGQPFDRARADARALAKEMKAEYRAILEAEVETDRLLFYKTYRAARHHADAPGFEGANPVFDFHFEQAAKMFEDILATNGGSGSLVSEPYRERARSKAASLSTIQTLIDTLVERINSAQLDQERLDFPRELNGGPDTKISFNRRKDPVATRDGIELSRKIKVRGTTATVAEFLDFSDFTPLQLWELMFLSGQRFEMTPELQCAAAAFLAECGVELGLDECLTAAGDAMDPAERTRLSAELAAIRAWNRLLASRADTPPENWNIDASQFVKEHRKTDFFVLIYGFDGAGRQSLLPDAVLQSFYDERLAPLEWK